MNLAIRIQITIFIMKKYNIIVCSFKFIYNYWFVSSLIRPTYVLYWYWVGWKPISSFYYFHRFKIIVPTHDITFFCSILYILSLFYCRSIINVNFLFAFLNSSTDDLDRAVRTLLIFTKSGSFSCTRKKIVVNIEIAIIYTHNY